MSEALRSIGMRLQRLNEDGAPDGSWVSIPGLLDFSVKEAMEAEQKVCQHVACPPWNGYALSFDFDLSATGLRWWRWFNRPKHWQPVNHELMKRMGRKRLARQRG